MSDVEVIIEDSVPNLVITTDPAVPNTIITITQPPNIVVEVSEGAGIPPETVRTISVSGLMLASDDYVRADQALNFTLLPATVGKKITLKNATFGNALVRYVADAGDINGIEGLPTLDLIRSGMTITLIGITGGWEIW